MVSNKGITETKSDLAGPYRLCLNPRTFDMASSNAAMILYSVQSSSTPPRGRSFGSKLESPTSPNLGRKLEFPVMTKKFSRNLILKMKFCFAASLHSELRASREDVSYDAWTIGCDWMRFDAHGDRRPGDC